MFACRSMQRGAALLAAISLTFIAQPSTSRADPITPEEAHAIGVDSYLYFYPLVTMDVTRQQLTNVEAGKSEIGGPMNMFANVQVFPTAPT
jgi:hypothetical protein